VQVQITADIQEKILRINIWTSVKHFFQRFKAGYICSLVVERGLQAKTSRDPRLTNRRTAETGLMMVQGDSQHCSL
jgi:hypothetical protein